MPGRAVGIVVGGKALRYFALVRKGEELRSVLLLDKTVEETRDGVGSNTVGVRGGNCRVLGVRKVKGDLEASTRFSASGPEGGVSVEEVAKRVVGASRQVFGEDVRGGVGAGGTTDHGPEVGLGYCFGGGVCR